MYIYIYVYIYGNHRNFRPIHFSSYGNLKVILETRFRYLSFSSFIMTSCNILYSLFILCSLRDIAYSELLKVP